MEITSTAASPLQVAIFLVIAMTCIYWFGWETHSMYFSYKKEKADFKRKSAKQNITKTLYQKKKTNSSGV